MDAMELRRLIYELLAKHSYLECHSHRLVVRNNRPHVIHAKEQQGDDELILKVTDMDLQLGLKREVEQTAVAKILELTGDINKCKQQRLL